MAYNLAQASSWYNLPILGPYGIAITTLTTVSESILSADPARAGVIFHNPGTQNKRVMPAGSALAGGAGGIVIYPQSEYILLKDANSQFNVNCEWIGVTDDNSDAALTIFNFTPNTPNAPEVRPTTRLLQQIPSSSPIGTQVTALTAGGKEILAADANRNGVQFHNPDASIIAAVCPSNLSPSIGAGSLIILPGQTKTIIGNDFVKVNCAWNGIAQSGSIDLTVLGLYG